MPFQWLQSSLSLSLRDILLEATYQGQQSHDKNHFPNQADNNTQKLEIVQTLSAFLNRFRSQSKNWICLDVLFQKQHTDIRKQMHAFI